jgi:hypothetical protein
MQNSKFLILIIVANLVSCFSSKDEKIRTVGCEMEIDSIYVSKNATRGLFFINDTLIMSHGFQSFKICYFDSIKLNVTFKRVDENSGEWCRIGQVKSPFWIHKRAGSDTIYVVQDGKEFSFRVLDHFCGDPIDYWN